MKVIASVAVSLDGYLDDASARRLALSSPEDWAEVYRLRASCDAILAGAETLRRDNPSLRAKGYNEDPLRVTVSRRGDLDPSLRFFTGPGRPLVFVEPGGGTNLHAVADVVEAARITPAVIAAELERRGVRTLMVEGGARTLRMFFEAEAVDELRMAVAPFFVDDPRAPRLSGTGRMKLGSVEKLGDMAVMHLLSADRYYLGMAIGESRLCTPSQTAYCVGAVVVTAAGEVYKGYTHETAPANHAEEEAIAKALAAGDELKGATMYSSMEPCSQRHSKPQSCSALIIKHDFARAVFALREPEYFVRGEGAEVLRSAGVDVTEIDDLGDEVRRINAHILSK